MFEQVYSLFNVLMAVCFGFMLNYWFNKYFKR